MEESFSVGWACFEARLGRCIEGKDLTRCPMNEQFNQKAQALLIEYDETKRNL